MKARLILLALLSLIPALIASSPPQAPRYLSPGELALSPDGRWLYIVCEKSDELLAIDIQTQKIRKRVTVGHVPRGLSVSADGKRIYVTSSWTDRVFVVDPESFSVVKELTTGSEPISVVESHDGLALFTANRLSNDVSVIDLQTGKEQERLVAGRGSSFVSAEPGSDRIYTTHVYPAVAVHYRTPPESEITVIDTSRKQVVDRKRLHNVAGVFHIAFSADGKLAAAAQLRPKNLIPLAHVEHGWVFGNSLTVFGEGFSGVVQVPLDELERYYALPFGVAIAPDHSRIYVSSAGSDVVTVIDVARLSRFAKAHAYFANDLSASANYVMARIAVGKNPRGMALAADGSRLYVANRMDDTIAVIDTAKLRVVATVSLGGASEITPLRRGEQLFNSARFSFQGHFGCANCHIDGTFDGLEWDLEPDGFGKDIVDNRLLEDLSGTEPFKWNGGNPDMPTECGPRTEKYFYRSQSYNDQELTDLVSFVLSQPFRPNRNRRPGGELTPAQERGKEIFERAVDKTGKLIPENNQCAFCHSGPKYTNRQVFDVGSGKPTDRSPLIDTPQLNNVYMTAPYLHDGSARSLEEIWTVFNPNDTHGRTNDLTKDELNDLIEYLRSL
ncbi:MAG TPA: cytochrome D1 domain-containing protein [Terriglobales bacterium]|nr:cytochrome D1 domain-containing protein [Terriglobales bacterium]